MAPSRKEASPVEIAALLMDAVCSAEEKEQEALRRLGDHLGVDPDGIRSELLFLKAFAVDFATAIALGERPERREILARYYRHWERIDQEVGSGLMEDLQARLRMYSEVIGASGSDPAGLKGRIGKAFARCCGSEGIEGDLTVLGGTMFGALFEEVVDLLQEIDIALYGFEEEKAEEG